MGKKVSIPQASDITGLSAYALYKGIRERRYPHIRTGLGSGRILIDVDLLEEYLHREAEHNASGDRLPTESNIVCYDQLRRVAE